MAALLAGAAILGAIAGGGSRLAMDHRRSSATPRPATSTATRAAEPNRPIGLANLLTNAQVTSAGFRYHDATRVSGDPQYEITPCLTQTLGDATGGNSFFGEWDAAGGGSGYIAESIAEPGGDGPATEALKEVLAEHGPACKGATSVAQPRRRVGSARVYAFTVTPRSAADGPAVVAAVITDAEVYRIAVLAISSASTTAKALIDDAARRLTS